MPTIPVTTASAAYPVHIGSGLLTSLAKHIPPAGKLFVVTSPEIWSLWHEKFLASFQKQSLDPTILFLPSGESSKRLRSIESLANQLVRAGAARDSLLIAFGGGVVGDLTGFLAAIYMRGIPCIQVPTTLLAQVDSSIGGKTGANLAAGKNLIGSFHHPLAVFADTAVLSTLPDRELRAGLFESLKAGIIYDPRLFAFMESNRDAILARDPKAIERVVSASVRVKADVVGKDERESGLRMILNFGHTTGHAIEAALNYKHLLHGEAVAHGMIAATRLAANRHALPAKTAVRIEQAILAYGPLPSLTLSAARLVALTASDKKNTSATRRFVLPTAIGKTSVVTDVTPAELTAAIHEMLALAAPPPQPQLKSRNPASRQAKSGKAAPINPYAELPTSGRSR